VTAYSQTRLVRPRFVHQRPLGELLGPPSCDRGEASRTKQAIMACFVREASLVSIAQMRGGIGAGMPAGLVWGQSSSSDFFPSKAHLRWLLDETARWR